MLTTISRISSTMIMIQMHQWLELAINFFNLLSTFTILW